jgi:hypothetical protein
MTATELSVAEARDRSESGIKSTDAAIQAATMLSKDIAWRGLVTNDLDVIVWPTLLATHDDFFSKFYKQEGDFAARWRQWTPGDEPDFEPGASPEAKQAARDALGVPA